VLRQALLLASRNQVLTKTVTSAPGIGTMVRRFAAGETTDDAVAATRELVSRGLAVTLDHLGEDTLDREQADASRDAYLVLLRALAEEGLTATAEVSVKLSAVGQALPGDGPKIATENAHAICAVAAEVGTSVTLDMEDHTTTDLTLETLRTLRTEFPNTGAVLQAYLYRTPADCRELATAGSRIRLCKGAYNEPESVAIQGRHEVDRAYVRCLEILMSGDGYPMLATHDPRLIAIGADMAQRQHRDLDSYEFQMLYGVRPEAQEELVAQGQTMRVYVPYGSEWYGYLVRRMAERPANLLLGARAFVAGVKRR
jgi:proline dehydrogenase